MSSNIRIVERTYLQYVAPSHGEGRYLEVCIGESDGTPSQAEPDPLVKILETDDYKMWLEIRTTEGHFRIALAELESAIAAAKKGVFSERRFDQEISPSLASNSSL